MNVSSLRKDAIGLGVMAMLFVACGDPGTGAVAENPCGGSEELRYGGDLAAPGDVCGPCAEAVLVCDGFDGLTCVGGESCESSWLVGLNPGNVSARGATFRASIIELPDAPVIDHGFCWSSDPDSDSPTCHSLGTASAAGIFSHSVDDLDPGRRYYVRAYGVIGTERTSPPEDALLTLAPGTNFQVSQGTHDDRVSLSWELVEGARGYVVVRDQVEITRTDANGSSYDDRSANAPSAPEAPRDLIATRGEHVDRVSLSWSASEVSEPRHAYRVDVLYHDTTSDNAADVWGFRASPPVTGYILDLDGEEIDLGLVTTYDDESAPAGALSIPSITATQGRFADRIQVSSSDEPRHELAPVSYRIRAYSGDARGAWSTEVEGYRGADSIDIAWERSSADSDEDYALIAGADGLTHDDFDVLAEGSARYYRLRLSADGLDSVVSDAVRGYAALLQAPAEVACALGQGDAFTLSWSAASGNVPVTGYAVYADDTRLVELPPDALTTTLTPGLRGPVFYEVRALAALEGGDTDLVSDAGSPAGCLPTQPSAPTAVTGDEAVTLTWTASALPSASVYEVYYRRAGGADPLDRVETTCTPGEECFLTISGLASLETYVFFLVATNAAGESVSSPETSTARVEVFVPAPPASALHSTIAGEDGIADGVSTSTVTIFLGNRDGDPVIGETPTFSASGSGNIYGPCSPTNAQGLSQCTLASTVGEPKTLRLTSPIAFDGPMVNFEQGCNPLGEPFGGGLGTQDQPFVLCSAHQLSRIDAQGLTGHFALFGDVDMADLGAQAFVVIGETVRFSGSFDGQGYTISNLVINAPQASVCGLFGYLGGEVRDLVLAGVDVSCDGSVGGLVGVTLDARIEGVNVSGRVQGTGDIVGGLVGIAGKGVIDGAEVNVEVTGSSFVGGLVGELYDEARVENAHARGNIEGTISVGGLVGLMRQDASVAASSSMGNVRGTSAVGGLVGSLTGNSRLDDSRASGDVDGEVVVGGLVGRVLQGYVARSYAAGSATSTRTVGNCDTGGLVGFISGGSIADAYALSSVHGERRPGGLVGSADKATIDRSYAAGPVVGAVGPGGLIGVALDAVVVNNSYWDREKTNQSASEGGTSLTTDQMGEVSNFSTWVFSPTLDYVWVMPEGGPPMLWFEE